MALWFLVSRDYDCGPLAAGQSGWSVIEANIHRSRIIDYAHWFSTQFPVLWMIIFGIVLVNGLVENKSTILGSRLTDQNEDN